jgi:glycosyltransferase involved in cell wall biosynthesis
MTTISIIVISKNSIETFPKCLESILSQNYDTKQVEVLLIDGGSTDGTIEYAEKNGVRVIRGGYPDNQEARRYIGVKESGGEILIFIDTDNVLPERNWIKKMILPFVNPLVGCSFTKWYGIDDSMSGIDKYYALMGGNDSVSYYLQKNDRVPLGNLDLPYGASMVYKIDGIEYVKFNSEKIPALGCNGFAVRSALMKNLNYKNPEEFMHIDANVDLINQNPEMEYAIVKTTIFHNTGKTLLGNLKKRIKYKTIHSDKLNHYRKYYIYDKRSLMDNIKLLVIIISALTIVIPMIRAIYGVIKTNRIEWIYHPLDLLGMVSMYGYSVVHRKFMQNRI